MTLFKSSQIIYYFMIINLDTLDFLRSIIQTTVLQQVKGKQKTNHCKLFHIQIDFIHLIHQPQLNTLIIKNYPQFIKILDQTINNILTNHHLPMSPYGNKIFFYYNNASIPNYKIKSTQFLTASLAQPQGVLVYLKDVEIVLVKQSELYLQSWSQIWEYVCECRFEGNTKNKLLKKRVNQTLLDIITKGSIYNLKENNKGIDQVVCQDCSMSLNYLGNEDLIYDHCQQIEVMIEEGETYFPETFQMLNIGNLKIIMEKSQAQTLEKGMILSLCGYLKVSVELSKPLLTNFKIQADFSFLLYFICSYPRVNNQNHIKELFFRKIKQIQLQQFPITKTNQTKDIVTNYKLFMQALNQLKFPYLDSNTLTAMKLVTLSSLFSLQQNQQKLNLLILTDQVSFLVKSLQIKDLSIKKLPSIYDEKTISAFFSNCKNSIVIIQNPDKKQFQLINRILRKQIYDNLNFVIWIICQPEQSLRKKLDYKQIQIILDLSIQKNTNVCQTVYLNMIDNYLQTFVQQTQDQLTLTLKRKYKQNLSSEYINEHFNTQKNSLHSNEVLKQERLANDVLKRYFLKSRQFKTTKLNNIETLTKIAESFMKFRTFIVSKDFIEGQSSKKSQCLSVLDVILTIFIDEQTSRNKYSSANTLFADQVSKIMLNENTCNVSIWDYQLQNEYVQETKRFIPRDQLVGMVVAKIFNLIYDQSIST